MKKFLGKQAAMLGIMAIGMSTLVTGCSTKEVVPQAEGTAIQGEAMTQGSIGDIAATSPMGMREIINYNGYRYVPVEGEVTLTMEDLGESLVGEEGIELYEVKGYDANFRIAVKQDEQIRMLQLVAKTDDSPMDITTYFATAKLQERVKEVQVFEHRGFEQIKTLTQEEVATLLAAFEKTEVATLSSEQYEEIASAQTDGRSYQLVFQLEDGTSISEYVIPSMGYVTVGDYTCTSDTLSQEVSSVFGGIEK